LIDAGLDLDAIAREMKQAQDACRQVTPFTARLPAFDLVAAYEVAGRIHGMRLAQGIRPVGRKLGFTNPGIWDTYNVHAPIWAHVYTNTVTMLEGTRARCPMRGLMEPRIEPEIVLGFREPPRVGASPEEIFRTVEWVAHGFEIVQSHFPAWKFRAPDTVADGALHGRLYVGPAQPPECLGADPVAALASFTVTLECDGREVDTGRGSNVIGSPLGVITHLLNVLGSQKGAPPLRSGEMVTTGTLTAAWPVEAGQFWRTRIAGIDVPGMEIEFT
jgi:2-oxo-3-hexenedioate decarboxylase